MLDNLLQHLRQVAPDRADIDILQSADPFLETAGEDLRRRIFITETIDGEVHCLRPEFTIPICLAHVGEHGKAGQAGRYAYGGKVFRQARTGASEFDQAGLEDLGHADTLKADVNCIRDLCQCLTQAGFQNLQITLGDQNLFAVVVESLHLPQAIARRLVRSFGAPPLMEAQISRLTEQHRPATGDGEVDQLALSADMDGLIALIEKKMRSGNLQTLAGRSPQAIAERMIEKTNEQNFQLSDESANVLRRFLELEMPLALASQALKRFAEETGLSFGLAGKDFVSRAESLAGAGLDTTRMIYKASLGRNLEYYTGVLFEASVGNVVVAGGGRYDRLCSLLGSKDAVPAVGFSISLDRLEETK